MDFLRGCGCGCGDGGSSLIVLGSESSTVLL